MNKRKLAILALGWWLWGVPSSQSLAEGDFQRETLRGLPGVWVVVEQLAPELKRAGVTQAQIQQEAEEKLRRIGLPLLNQEECWQTPGMPWLYLTVAVLKTNDTTYAATIAAVLYQEVRLTRTPQIKTFGVTWDTGVRLGRLSAESLLTVRQSVGDLIDQFTADYQAVNPGGEK